jgi:hypothetical protein
MTPWQELAMNLAESTQSESAPEVQTVLPSSSLVQRGEISIPPSATNQSNSGYGLPCAKCKTYYPASLTICPVCKSQERVSPVVDNAPATSVTAEQTPDPEVLEQERERFLQEFKSQIYSGEMQIHATSNFHCNQEDNHHGEFQPAAVCQSCFDHMRERVDQAEAALLIDIKEATQIIYEAVWSDPSDPTKTYQNAALALLHELRRRAGIPTLIGSSLQPLSH